MKRIFADIALLIIFLAFYLTGAYGWFSSKNILYFSIILVAVLLLIGLKVFGNPFGRGKDND